VFRVHRDRAGRGRARPLIMAGHMANVKDWILPDCMMPDGGDPCRGFQQLYAEHAKLDAENERLRAALERPTMECPTCAERGYDNADYHRLHRAWCDSVAENERLRAALEQITRECNALNKGPVAVSLARAALASQASSS
jgi:hypothetical protein